jgi:hypothetical protein
MHYFFGLEVWKVSGEIFPSQGKYAVEILRGLWMDDCRLMTTPMVTNIKKFVTLDSYLVEPRLYIYIIGSLMYLFNTRTNICFVVNKLSEFMVEMS